jgi:hypothetical protein
MELPTAPFYRRWSFILAGVIGLAAIVALLGWQGFQEADGGPTTLTTVPATTQPPSTTEPSSTIGPTSKPYQLLWEEQNVDGKVRSDAFEAPSVWRIEWTFDCSNFKDFGIGNFKITGSNGDFQRIQIESTRIRDEGVEILRRGGFGYLYVETVCDRWSVRALSG